MCLYRVLILANFILNNEQRTYKKEKPFLDHHYIHIGNFILSRVDICKFLGIWIDQYLTFKPHIQYLINKISKNIAIISCILQHNKGRSLYHNITLFSRISMFWIIVIWYGLLITHLTYFLCLNSKKNIYIIALQLSYNCHAGPFFKNLKILEIQQINYHHAGIFMYIPDYCILPCLFNKFFVKPSPSSIYTPIHTKI